MKRLRNVEGKNEEKLEVIKYQGEKQLKLLESVRHKGISEPKIFK